MKKIGTALLVADILLCLLLAVDYGFRRGHEWEQVALSDAAQEEHAAREEQEGTGEWQQEQVQEVRRVAITFDDEGIIGIGVLPEKGHRRVVYSACALFGLSCGKVG